MRQNNFDFLRFVFAFIVVCGHIVVISGVDAFKPFAPVFDTYLSVTGFFCISGFLITRSYVRTQSVKHYFKKRAARILPPYVLVIFSCVLLLSLVSSYDMHGYFTNPQLYEYLLANLTFLNFLEPCLPGVFTSDSLVDCSVNGALWTLKVEVAFYVLVPVLLWLVNKVSRKYLLFVLIYVLSVAYRTGLGHWGDVTDNHYWSILARQLPGFMSYFVCGMVLHYYFDFFIRRKWHFFFIGLCVFLLERHLGWEVLTPLAFASMIFAVAYSFKGLNSFGKYGDISYGIYIYHCPVIKLAADFGLFERHNPYWVACGIIVLVLILGFLSWHLLEKRFLKREKGCVRG